MNFANKEQIKIVYIGTPLISAKVLERLIENHYQIIALITNEDRPVGRKKELIPTPCKQVALNNNIKVYQPHKIKEDYSFLKDLDFDVLLTMAYGQIVPKAVLDFPKYGALNLHGSILPKYRGAAPIQRAIMDGESKTGITLMQMVEKMDAGDIFATKEISIEENDNYSTLSDKLSTLAFEVADENLLPYVNGLLKGKKQDENLVTFASKIKSEDEHIPLSNLTAIEFCNYVRGLSFTPGAYLFLDNLKFKIYSCQYVSNKTNGKVGFLLIEKKNVYLCLKDGMVRLDKVQLQGKKEMDASSFANGYRDLSSKVLS